MCKNCGCDHAGKHRHRHGEHSHDGHEHVHYDENGHAYSHRHDPEETKKISLESALLAANDNLALANRVWLGERGIAAVNLISSPGSGKTALLERTLELCREAKINAAVIVGDQYGELDAVRMRDRGAPVVQIETRDGCHLNAGQVTAVLSQAAPEGTELLIIENVGNLVCPAAFDLGEDCKVVLLSTPEGEEKPVKYPGIFAAADLALLTKMDLAQVLGWDRESCTKNIFLVNPECRVVEISVRSGLGMDRWMEYLKKLIETKKVKK